MLTQFSSSPVMSDQTNADNCFGLSKIRQISTYFNYSNYFKYFKILFIRKKRLSP